MNLSEVFRGFCTGAAIAPPLVSTSVAQVSHRFIATLCYMHSSGCYNSAIPQHTAHATIPAHTDQLTTACTSAVSQQRVALALWPVQKTVHSAGRELSWHTISGTQCCAQHCTQYKQSSLQPMNARRLRLLCCCRTGDEKTSPAIAAHPTTHAHTAASPLQQPPSLSLLLPPLQPALPAALHPPLSGTEPSWEGAGRA